MADNNADLVNVVEELSAANDPITALGLDAAVTPRTAIKWVYWKVCSVLTLSGRPRDPRLGDDLYGHVLSMRAEIQILRGLITKLCQQANPPINPDVVATQIQEALK